MNGLITRAEVVLHRVEGPEAQSWEVRVVSSGALLFVTSTPNALDAQLHAFSAGLIAGIQSGREAQQQEIRDALGIA
jgi:hypothetical protein